MFAPAVRRRAARRRAVLTAAVTCRRQSSMVVSIAQLACRELRGARRAVCVGGNPCWQMGHGAAGGAPIRAAALVKIRLWPAYPQQPEGRAHEQAASAAQHEAHARLRYAGRQRM